MNWIREAVTDENGVTDVAYVSIIWILAVALGAVTAIVCVAVVSYFRCYAVADVGGGIRAQVPCTFDPQPVGIAVGAVFGGFATALGALAGYMAATRRREPPRPVTTTTTTTDNLTQTRTATP